MSRIQFTNRSGLVLTGNLEVPAGGEWQATALFAHCFTCTRNVKAARNITRALADEGFAVLRFDFTGLGESDGDFSDTSFSSNLDDLEDAANWMATEMGAPQLLVLHSPVDKTVSIDNARKIFAAALHPKSFVSLDQADHLLSDDADSKYAGRVISTWASRFLEFESPAPIENVEVSGRTADKFLCRVQAGRHTLLADEPDEHGGTDLGPDPYKFLASALATCTVMTLNMYARHKKLPVERVGCEVSHDRIHAEDCVECEKNKGKVDRLTRVITIEGDLDGDQRARMLEIADRCPVHRTLENEIRVESRLA